MKKYFKKILFACLLCTLTLCLFVGGKTLKVKADETYNFANITEEESLEFLVEHNIEIPAIFRGNREEIGRFTQNAIKLVYETPSYEFIYNYDKILNFANDIKQAVLPYLNEQNISTQSCAPYFLRYNTVKNSSGEWVTQNGAWDDKWLNYNCYAFSINRNEQPSFYGTGMQYQPGDMAPGDANFDTIASISGFADLVKQDLVAMGYNNIVLSTTIPSITTEQSLICVRRGTLDYHFMKYDLVTDSWYHKPGQSAILKYDGVPNNSDVWYGEASVYSHERIIYDPAHVLPVQMTYYSDIYFIKYDRNVTNISSPTSSASCNLNVNAGKDSILEIKSTVNNKYFEFTTTAENSFEALLFDKNMELLTTYTRENMRFLKFYRALSNDTYYLKFNFKNVSDSGSILTTISAHNHQLAYQNNSSNHRETCSFCGYDEVVSHSYTNSYTRYNSAQHTAYCACGASKVENHSYTVRYQDTDSSTHIAYCACGANTSVNHSYDHRYKKKDTTSHYSYCVCGRYTTGGHVINGVLPGNQHAICILCKGLAEIGFVEMGLSEIMSNRIITANGSYILPNGVIVLSDADYQGYLNGTFVIPHSHDVAA